MVYSVELSRYIKLTRQLLSFARWLGD